MFLHYSKLKTETRLTMPKERLDYLSIPSTENDIAKSLSYEEEVKVHTAKKVLRIL